MPHGPVDLQNISYSRTTHPEKVVSNCSWDIGRVHAAKVSAYMKYMMIKAGSPSTNISSHVESALWTQAKAHFRSSVASA